MKARFGFLALLFLWSVVHSAQASDPVWINGGGMEQYRSDRYLTAIGEGESREDARKNAIARLAEQLKVSISSQSDISKQFRSDNRQTETSERMDVRINTRVDLSGLEGVRIVEEYRQRPGGSWYAFGVLDREKNATNLAFGVESRFDEVRSAIKDAQRLIARGKTADGLSKLLKASHRFAQIDKDIDLHRLFAPAELTGMLRSERMEAAVALEQYLNSVLQDVRVQVVGKGTQAGSPELGVRDPFRVRLSYRGAALAQLPVKVVAEDAATVIDADNRTDARGELTVRVRSFPYTGKAQNKITVKLDVDETAIASKSPFVELFILQSQKSEVTILLKSKISNRFDDFLYLAVNDGLASVLSQQNYNVISDDQGYAGNSDYVVSVQASATDLPGYGGLYFVKFNGVVSVRSHKSGRVLKTLRINSEATKAGGLSVQQAAQKAAFKLVDAIKQDLLQTLEKNLGRE